MKDVINTPSITLGALKNELGRDWVIAYVTVWLIELNDNSNVKTKMSDAQMEFTAERIYESYSLKITDLTLFFRNVKEGVYGSFYENLSQEKVMEWLRIYFDLRCEYGQMQSQSNHSGFSATKDKIPKEVIDKLFSGVGEQKVEHKHEKNGVGIRTKQLLDLKILKAPTEELKEYLIKSDTTSEFYDKDIYELVEKEIDSRTN